MNERMDDSRDAEIAARLRSALGETPPALLARLERAATNRPRLDAETLATPLWLELGPPVAAVVLLFIFVAAVVPRLRSPDAFLFLVLPLAILLSIELVRGAPLVRSWLR